MGHSRLLGEPEAPALDAALLRFIDALSSNVAILRADGVITAVNRWWRHFATENGGRCTDFCVGMNYFTVCEQAAPTCPEAVEVVSGLSDVIDGNSNLFVHLYQMPVRGEIRHYKLAASKFELASGELLLVAHDDITAAIRLEEQRRERAVDRLTAQLEARRQIGRELNENSGQYLTAMSLILAKLRQQPFVDALAEPLAEFRDLLTVAQEEIRTLSYLFDTPTPAQVGLRETLQQYVAGFSRRTGIAVSFEWHVAVSEDLAGGEAVLLRIVQEALTEIYRKSDTTAAKVVIASEGRQVTIVIEDYGTRAVPPKGSVSARLGSVQARAAELGGTIRWQPRQRGLALLAALPLPVPMQKGPLDRAVSGNPYP